MVRDEQLVFFLGIPGSGWAKIDSLLRCCSNFKFNMSDYNEDRCMKHEGRYYVEHKGHFIGPGMTYGEKFDDIPENYTKEEFIQECIRPYEDINDNDNYMIKCHWFCEEHNIRWLFKHFPNNKYICVLRDRELCDDRWLTSMTFDKDYPRYTAWMVKDDPDESAGVGNHCKENEDNFKEINHRHNVQLRAFVRRTKNSVIISPTRFTLGKMGFVWDQNGEFEYTAYIRNYCVDYSIYTRSPSWDTAIAFINCEDEIGYG